MSYATAKDIPVDTIPVIDIAPVRAGDAVGTRHVAAQMQQAAGDIGFFYITNHGVDDNLIQETLHVAREFFELPEIDKRSVKVTPKKRGYIEPSTAKMKGGKKLDFRETFLWGREFTSETLATLAEIPLIGPNQWPQALPNMPEVFNNYFETCVELGRELLRVFALALGVESDYFAGRFKHTMARGSALYYPPQPAEMGRRPIWYRTTHGLGRIDSFVSRRCWWSAGTWTRRQVADRASHRRHLCRECR